MPDLKVAYREIGQDDFTILHPAGLTRFAIDSGCSPHEHSEMRGGLSPDFASLIRATRYQPPYR